MENVFTVKAVISNKAVLAYTLASQEGLADVFKDGIANRLELSGKVGELFFKQMDLLNEKEYLDSSVERVKNDDVLMKLAKDLKKTLKIDIFLRNTLESISKGYITFTDVGISPGDYVFGFKAEFCLAHFISIKKCQTDTNLFLEDEIRNLFNSYKTDLALVKKDIDSVISNNQLDDLNKFSSYLLDNTMREAKEKQHRIDMVVKTLIEQDIAEFTLLS